MYEIYRHFYYGQEKAVEKDNLLEALRYMYEETELTADNGHAVSIWNDSGSIFEVNYWGNVEIDVDNCATKEELAQIKNYVVGNGLRWDSSLDKELLSSTADFYVLEGNILLSFSFKREYSLDKVFDDLENFYYQWLHPEFEDKELAAEIENETPDDWIVDHMYNYAEYEIEDVVVRHKDFKYLYNCADFNNFLMDCLSHDDLLLLEGIIEAYATGRIDIKIVRGEDEQIDFDKSFDLIINDETYVPFEDGLDVVAIKWYESFEDTGYLVETLRGHTAHEIQTPSLDNRVQSALARAADAQQTDHANTKGPEPAL